MPILITLGGVLAITLLAIMGMTVLQHNSKHHTKLKAAAANAKAAETTSTPDTVQSITVPAVTPDGATSKLPEVIGLTSTSLRNQFA